MQSWKLLKTASVSLRQKPIKVAFQKRNFAGGGGHGHGHGHDIPANLLKFTRDEVSKHNTPNDCWIIVENKVYNVTRWIAHHPGGKIVAMKAGRDSTDLFQSRAHSEWAQEKMNEFLIGYVDHSTRPISEFLPFNYGKFMP